MYAEPLHNELPPMTEAAYLAFADAQEFKYEYRNGEIIAMTGGSVRHGVITMNMGTHLNNLLGERDCSVTSPDVRVHIAAKRAYRYPDITLFCGEPEYLEGRTDTITNPVLLVEVLSPGTAHIDYGEKLAEYTRIESLQAYVLISQDRPELEVYRRYESGQWLYINVSGLDAEVDVPMPGGNLHLSLAQIYRRIRWDEENRQEDGDSENP
ncbi:MAG: Uma2 family endonuclease [Chloroflexota bacterium]